MQSRSSPPSITEHRLKRLTTWVRLTLVWAAAAALLLAAPHHARAFVERMLRYAGMLLIARALLRLEMPRHARRAHVHLLRPSRAVTNRRILGSRFRRATRARGLIAQARAIADVLSKAETWIARIMRRRLSRLTPVRTSPASTMAIRTAAHAAARPFVNSS